ncbi:MAG: radical SAM protein [Candidatus Jordarchaeales archaeon]
MSEPCVPKPFSGGIFLSYKCNLRCRHCMYACSPRWKGDWISEEDALKVLSQLAEGVRGRYPDTELVGINYGFHFTGGEPFLKFDLLLELVEASSRLGLPSTFVETNCFWCRSYDDVRGKMEELKGAGLKGILVSVNPFIVESVPFERIERAVRVGVEVFGRNVIVYQALFFELFKSMGLRGTMSFQRFLEEAGGVLRYAELIPAGRAPYKLGDLYVKYPAKHFFGSSCRREILRDWHIHVDNYCNYIPGYCAGISFGDARNMSEVCSPLSLKKCQVVKALLSDLRELYELGRKHGYKELEEGYVSKCHLCLDIRRHLVSSGEFPELKPVEFYDHIED